MYQLQTLLVTAVYPVLFRSTNSMEIHTGTVQESILHIKVTDSIIIISLPTVTMGNCFKRQDPEPTSEAIIIQDLMEVITHLSQELSYWERDLRMVRSQDDVFLQQVETKDKEIRILHNKLQSLHSRKNSLKQKRVYFST